MGFGHRKLSPNLLALKGFGLHRCPDLSAKVAWNEDALNSAIKAPPSKRDKLRVWLLPQSTGSKLEHNLRNNAGVRHSVQPRLPLQRALRKTPLLEASSQHSTKCCDSTIQHTEIRSYTLLGGRCNMRSVHLSEQSQVLQGIFGLRVNKR